MMRSTMGRVGRRAWMGLGLVVLLPSWAQAQLFPNRTVTRERQPCASEPPFYAQVRQNYFGYYPTCWNRFPAGWGCPCPTELPNAAASFAAQPRDKLSDTIPDEGLDGMGEDPALQDPRPGARPGEAEMPALPGGGRSPFESDPTRPDPGTGRPARGTDLPPQTSRTPAAPPAARPTTRAAAPLTSPPVPAPTTGLLEMPRVLPPVAAAPSTQPAPDPGMLAMAPDATLASTTAASSDRPNLGPLPAAPLPDGSIPGASPMGIDPALLSQNQPTVAAAPAQAPQRRGLLSGLLNSSKRRR